MTIREGAESKFYFCLGMLIMLFGWSTLPVPSWGQWMLGYGCGYFG